MHADALLKFVVAVAKSTTCGEETGWQPDEPPVSDDNRGITCDQASWADNLIREARILTQIDGPDIPIMFEVTYKSPQHLSCKVEARDMKEAITTFQKTHNEEIVMVEKIKP